LTDFFGLAHKVAYEVAGYLHRDISAGNIMIHKGRGLLIDWDLAKKKDNLGENPQRRSATVSFIS
jgi:RIO-like serine/threonine protein kinase